MIRKTFTAIAICLSIVAIASSTAFAGTTTTTLSVTAIVGATCNVSTSAVSFGQYDPISTNVATPLNATGSVYTTCSNGLTNTLTLDQGLNAGPGSTDSTPQRQMRSGSNVLDYFLYTNSSRTTVFGNSAGTGAVLTGTGSNAITTIYGQVTPGQNVSAGAYADTVVVTVTY